LLSLRKAVFLGMFLYNVTVGVDRVVEAEWIQWMKAEHIPNVMKTGLFTDHKMYKVHTGEDEPSASYAIQYFSPTLDQVQLYLDKFAPILREEANQKFGSQQAAYRTLLEEV
jgi:hypothetical protein